LLRAGKPKIGLHVWPLNSVNWALTLTKFSAVG
jgi:hypothetical protein